MQFWKGLGGAVRTPKAVSSFWAFAHAVPPTGAALPSFFELVLALCHLIQGGLSAPSHAPHPECISALALTLLLLCRLLLSFSLTEKGLLEAQTCV